MRPSGSKVSSPVHEVPGGCQEARSVKLPRNPAPKRWIAPQVVQPGHRKGHCGAGLGREGSEAGHATGCRSPTRYRLGDVRGSVTDSDRCPGLPRPLLPCLSIPKILRLPRASIRLYHPVSLLPPIFFRPPVASEPLESTDRGLNRLDFSRGARSAGRAGRGPSWSKNHAIGSVPFPLANRREASGPGRSQGD